MTEQPKPTTITLDTPEWGALIVHNLSEAARFVQQVQAPNADVEQRLIQHLSRLAPMVTAWVKMQAAKEAQAAAAQAASIETAEAKPNGAVGKTSEPVVKDRRKRRTKAEMEAERAN